MSSSRARRKKAKGSCLNQLCACIYFRGVTPTTAHEPENKVLDPPDWIPFPGKSVTNPPGMAVVGDCCCTALLPHSSPWWWDEQGSEEQLSSSTISTLLCVAQKLCKHHYFSHWSFLFVLTSLNTSPGAEQIKYHWDAGWRVVRKTTRKRRNPPGNDTWNFLFRRALILSILRKQPSGAARFLLWGELRPWTDLL